MRFLLQGLPDSPRKLSLHTLQAGGRVCALVEKIIIFLGLHEQIAFTLVSAAEI